MAILTLMLASCVMATLATWAGVHALRKEYFRYRTTFQHETVLGMADFFLFLDPSQLWGVNLLLAGVASGVLFAAGAHPLVASVAGIFMLTTPRFALAWARRRRTRQIDAQLPDFLLALAGALRAGQGLQAGLRQIVRHTSRPLSQEWNLILQQQRMGESFNDALDAFHLRVETEAVSLVVAAIKVAGQTGGSLAETLERISLTLRLRLQLLGKIQSLTAQGRMQAWIMAALPLALAMALHVLDPDSMNLLWRSPAGWAVMALIAGLECVGVLLVRRIVNIEV